MRYRVVISHVGDPVLQLSRQFSYSSGYTSECIEEKVSGELEEGTEFSVQVFLDDEDTNNSSSFIKIFSKSISNLEHSIKHYLIVQSLAEMKPWKKS